MPWRQLIVLTALASLAACGKAPQGAEAAALAAEAGAPSQVPVALVTTPAPAASAADFVAKASAGELATGINDRAVALASLAAPPGVSRSS